MLLRENRLKNKKDFKKIFEQGKGFRQDFLFLKIIKNNLGKTKFGFVVSKKVSKKAVTRNKIKRQLREIVRNKLKKEQIKIGIDGVLVVLQDIDGKDFKEIEKVIGTLFKKAGVIINNK